jgi:hypothetical protein
VCSQPEQQAGAMIQRKRLFAVSLVIEMVLTGCGFVHDQTIDGPYRLVAIDVNEQMNVCYSIQDSCIGRIGETVFAVGHDASYIVAARHPSNNRKVTEYFYLIRSLDGPIVDPSASVQGPYDAVKFEAERVRLRLPAFDTNIASLR